MYLYVPHGPTTDSYITLATKGGTIKGCLWSVPVKSVVLYQDVTNKLDVVHSSFLPCTYSKSVTLSRGKVYDWLNCP